MGRTQLRMCENLTADAGWCQVLQTLGPSVSRVVPGVTNAKGYQKKKKKKKKKVKIRKHESNSELLWAL